MKKLLLLALLGLTACVDYRAIGLNIHPRPPAVVVTPPVIAAPPAWRSPWADRNPTWDEKLAIRMSFATHNDDNGVPVFDPFWSGLRRDQRDMWAANKRRRGLTHILISRTWQYAKYEQDPRVAAAGIKAGSLTYDELRGRIAELVHEDGLLPDIWLPFDDDAAGQAAVYDGRMERELAELLPVKDLIAGVAPAWETPGAWRSKAIVDAGNLMRRVLGPDVPLILHGRDNERFTGASYLGITELGQTIQRAKSRQFYDDDAKRDRLYWTEDDDPSDGDEVGWWRLVPFDIFAWESRHGRDGPSFTDGSPDTNSGTWLGRFLEGFERFAPPGTRMPAQNRNVREKPDGSSNGVPDWFGGSAKRVLCVPLELQEYEDVTDTVSDDRIVHVADLLYSHGVTTFGSGVPTAYLPIAVTP